MFFEVWTFFVLYIRLKALVPVGRLIIPEQIEHDSTPFYKALANSDEAWADKRIDPMVMNS